MGRGGAQLGKPVKGRSREQGEKAKGKGGKEEGGDKVANDNLRVVEEYDRLNKLADVQRYRMKRAQQQEMFNTRINKRILASIHKKFMRAEKVESLRKEIEVLAQRHSREVDRKDAIIQMMTRDLDDTEEQLEVARRAHLDRMTAFVQLHRHKIAQLDREFEDDLKALKTEFLSEFEELKKQHAREVRELNAVIKAVEKEDELKTQQAKAAHQAERERLRNASSEAINELRIGLENRIEELEKVFSDAHNAYYESTYEKNRLFHELQGEDRRLTVSIQQRKRKIERLSEELAYWRRKVAMNREEYAAKNDSLLAQRDYIFKQCTRLKRLMKRDRDADRRRLADLSLMAREALQKNLDKAAFAEKLLHTAELARKYETEREKVLPIDDHALKLVEASMLKGEDGHERKDDGDSLGMGETNDANPEMIALGNGILGGQGYSHLDGFYRRYNKVLLDKLAIKHERARLMRENADLRAILKQYLEGIAVTETAVDDANPLLIVNGRVNIANPQGQTRRKATVVVEGALAAKTYQVQMPR